MHTPIGPRAALNADDSMTQRVYAPSEATKVWHPMWRGPDVTLGQMWLTRPIMRSHERTTMDRTRLAKQRQRMRLKHKNEEAPDNAERGAKNASLLVRQVLQRKHFGDVELYLNTTKKPELFQLMADIAQYAYEIREQHEEDMAKLRDELETSEQRIHTLTGQLVHVETQHTELQEEHADVQRRLQTTYGEYSAVVDSLRKTEEKLATSLQRVEHQQQVLHEMARTLDERATQIQSLQQNLDETRANYASAKREIDETKMQMQALQLANDRMKEQARDERQENKALAWELQAKTRECSDVSSELEAAKGRIMTLESQLQMEAITRQSVVKERDHALLLHRREREEWKRAQDSRLELDRQKAQDYRSMDMEIRQLTQVVSRLRSELDTERVLREKAEDTAMKATGIAEELRAASRTLHADLQNATSQLNEERSSREAKEGALALANRDLQSLQKRLREEEVARADAQGEVEALMHRMKLIRRDHLAMLHRVEAPAQLIARWKDGSCAPLEYH